MSRNSCQEKGYSKKEESSQKESKNDLKEKTNKENCWSQIHSAISS